MEDFVCNRENDMEICIVRKSGVRYNYFINHKWRVLSMTKEHFFEEHMGECFERVEDNLKEILEGIREYNGMSEDEFYTQIIEEGDECSCGTYTIFKLIVDALELCADDYLNSYYARKFISLSFIKAVYRKVTGEDIQEVYSNNECDYEKLSDDLFQGFCLLMEETEIKEDEEEVMELLTKIIKQYCNFAYFCPCGKEDGLTKFHILISQPLLNE